MSEPESEVAFLRTQVIGLETKICEALSQQSSALAAALHANATLAQILMRQIERNRTGAAHTPDPVAPLLTGLLGGATFSTKAREDADKTPQSARKSARKRSTIKESKA